MFAAAAVVTASVATSTVAFAASGGGGWSIQHTPNPKGGSPVLSSVSCSSVRACTAVGDYYIKRDNNTALLAERWNGTRWSIQRIPPPAGAADGSSLGGVSCTSPNACTAVGAYYDKRGNGKTLAERWNGSKWSIQHTPNPDNANYLGAVSCTSPNACTAVGVYDHNMSPGESTPEVTLAERWNGSKWSIQQTPTLATNTEGAVLSGVSCSSQSACTAVGNYANPGGYGLVLAERWNGSKWSIQPISDPQPTPYGFYAAGLTAVSCPSNSSCKAVGHYTNKGGLRLTLAERWNGRKWSLQHTPNPRGTNGSELLGASCHFRSACIAVGDYFTHISLPLAERWNGSKWSIQHTPKFTDGKGINLVGVSCSSKNACTAVGHYFNGKAVVTLAERWNGS